MPWMEISPRVFESLQRDTVLNNRLLEVRVNNLFFSFFPEIKMTFARYWGRLLSWKFSFALFLRIRILPKSERFISFHQTLLNLSSTWTKKKGKVDSTAVVFRVHCRLCFEYRPADSFVRWDPQLNVWFLMILPTRHQQL